MKYLYESINDYSNDDYLSFYNSLPLSEKRAIDKIINPVKRKQRILSRIMLIDFLSKEYNINYKENTIKYNSFGKPLINNINFNISHSYDYVILAFSNNHVGVDIEKKRSTNLMVMKEFCTLKEQTYINNSKDKYLAFWIIYTLKEAYFKMLGTNLFNMKKVEFNILDEKIICVNNPNLKILLSTEIGNYIFAIIYE